MSNSHWYPEGTEQNIPSGAERYVFVRCSNYIMIVPCSNTQMPSVINRLSEIYGHVEVSITKPTIKGDYLLVEASDCLR